MLRRSIVGVRPGRVAAAVVARGQLSSFAVLAKSVDEGAPYQEGYAREGQSKP
jgi:hypothetical protein